MSGLNWRKAQLAGKRSLSTLDEAEYRDRDAASRWLTRHEKPAKKAGKNSKFVAASPSQAVANAGAVPSQSSRLPIPQSVGHSCPDTSLAAREADKAAAPIIHNTSAWSAS